MRFGEGVIVRRANASIGKWKSQAYYCFQNVDEWVRDNPNTNGSTDSYTSAI
jgi:hypothetical protein